MISIVQKVNQEPIARAELKVNGKEIKLNNFVESFISQTVIGMVNLYVALVILRQLI